MVLEYKPSLKEIDIDIARKVVEDRLKLSAEIPRPSLVVLNNQVAITKKAREYFSSEEGTRYLSAGAILISNYIHRLGGNILLKLNPPVMPARLFTDRAKAMDWLSKFTQDKLN